MRKEEFGKIRHSLGKTQKQMAQLLGVSIKAVQSFEQGWRKIPAHIERQLLYLFILQQPKQRKFPKCWNVNKCSPQQRLQCPAWELKYGHHCWFINGTFCQGKAQDDWHKKMEICRQCHILKSNLPF
jgi:hypothetical protein